MNKEQTERVHTVASVLVAKAYQQSSTNCIRVVTRSLFMILTLFFVLSPLSLSLLSPLYTLYISLLIFCIEIKYILRTRPICLLSVNKRTVYT